MRGAITFALLLAGSCAHAQTAGKFAWQDYSHHLKASQEIAVLGPDFAGDGVALSNGGLSFTVTDVSLPGSNALEVAFTRTYQVKNWKDLTTEDMLGDWDVAIPNISGTFTTDWVAQGASPGNRCSVVGRPPLPPSTVSGYHYSDYWQGLTVTLPGGASSELMGTRSGARLPATGGPYPWTSQDGQTLFSCLPALQGGGTGQGFLARMPDGTKIWFDRMAQQQVPRLKGKKLDIYNHVPVDILVLRRNALYATRIEDRFGNYVTYSYSNAWNQPMRLTGIASSDGRQISIGYSAGVVSTVSDGTRTWTYGYASTPGARKTLTSVLQPDSRSWSIAFTQFTDAEIRFNEVDFGEPVRSCVATEVPQNIALQPVGTVTHPSGASASFTVFMQQHGRSNVPVNCENVEIWGSPGDPYGSTNNTGDDINHHAISNYSFTLKKKMVTGTGLEPAEWNYSYEPGISWIYKNGATHFYPVCDYSTYSPTECAAPRKCGTPAVLPCEGSSRTTVAGPGGSWTRYTHGNSYRYNEGKLLKVESGTSASNILRSATHAYDFSLVDQAYPRQFGSSLRVREHGFESEFHRPLLSTSTTLQGRTFSLTNSAFDDLARPIEIVRRSEGAP